MHTITVESLANVHSHLREGDVVQPLVELAIKGGADVLLPMPNTQEGLCTVHQVLEYCGRLGHGHNGISLIPCLLLNQRTTVDEICQCVGAGIRDCKVYPLNRTNKSHNGVRNYARLLDVIHQCGKVGMKVHFHPEHPDLAIPNRDAEYQFYPLVDMFLHETSATLIWEHGTDARCIPHWKTMARSGRFFVTLTAHHLATNEDESFGDVRTVCKPPIKTQRDTDDLVKLVAENNPWVMAGLDDAPHDVKTKHVAHGQCACGAYTAPFGLQLYAHALDHMLGTDAGVKTFVNFTSQNARTLYKLMPSRREIKLVYKPFFIPPTYTVGPWIVEPFGAGGIIDWSLE